MEIISKSVLDTYENLAVLNTQALSKQKDTAPQTTLSKERRLKNIAGSFNADKNIITGRNIILIDDVLTTGSTIKEAETTLKKAGAKNVLCVSLAH
jgi:predicted amidophosphoribosyltransferase